MAVEAEPSDTIGDLKAKIKEYHGHDIDKQNILFLGRNLVNDRTLESCNISEKGFLVLTISMVETVILLDYLHLLTSSLIIA
ncbi:hypothetical protein V8E55_003018 [Tylopilus felleus]